jgi:hypothetical protein
MSRLGMAVVVVAAVAAVLLNVLLLDRVSGGSDPVGKLGPIASLPGRPLPAAPPGVVQPSSGPIQGEGRDD